MRHWLTALIASVAATRAWPVDLGPRQQTPPPTSSPSGSISASSSAFSPVPTSDIDPRLPQPTPAGEAPGPYPTVGIYPAGYRVDIVGRRPTQTYDTFQGIPFARPPTNELRFAAPQPPAYNATIDAGAFAPACAQTVYSRHQTYQDLQGDYGTSEDCLYLNVVRPTGLNSSSALPVLVFLHGGNFYGGAASSYDGSIVGQIAGDMGMPFLQVTLPYRVGVLGWPLATGAEAESTANLGLKDAMLGLEWVRDHIWAFGGDASKVTAAGQSAGGATIALLYLRPEINLFRSAILMSASPSLYNAGPINQVNPEPWRSFVAAVNCTASEGDELACLRSRNVSAILDAQSRTMDQHGPYELIGPVVDGSSILASPYEILGTGAFRSAPVIVGAVKDEGTSFVLPNISLAEFEDAVRDGGRRDNASVQDVLRLYPDDPAEGSPFGSGNDTFGYSPEFKRAAAYWGDAYFQAPRRYFLDSLRYFGVEASWGYMFGQAMPTSLGIPAYIGTGHHSDTIWSFGRVLTPLFNYTIEDQTLSLEMIRYFVNFIHHSDPNPDPSVNTTTAPTTGFSVANTTAWPAYGAATNTTAGAGNLLRFVEDGLGVMTDDFRSEAINFFIERREEWDY